MPSTPPKEYGAVLLPPTMAAQIERFPLSLGQFTANTTVNPAPKVVFDRPAVIREIWIAADAIPADPDGTMLLNAIVRDISEAANDTIVASADLEALVLVADKGYKLTFAAETAENELTVEAGDTLRFSLVNNSAAIGTNANISVSVLVQFTQSIDTQ